MSTYLIWFFNEDKYRPIANIAHIRKFTLLNKKKKKNFFTTKYNTDTLFANTCSRYQVLTSSRAKLGPYVNFFCALNTSFLLFLLCCIPYIIHSFFSLSSHQSDNLLESIIQREREQDIRVHNTFAHCTYTLCEIIIQILLSSCCCFFFSFFTLLLDYTFVLFATM